jgi:hypothetical protein
MTMETARRPRKARSGSGADLAQVEAWLANRERSGGSARFVLGQISPRLRFYGQSEVVVLVVVVANLLVTVGVLIVIRAKRIEAVGVATR